MLNSSKVNKKYVKKILNYVKAPPYADSYGRWGALNRKQREAIMELCLSWLYLDSIVSSIPINKDGTYNIQFKEDKKIGKLEHLNTDYHSEGENNDSKRKK